MAIEEGISCVVSGSFTKFKAEIDEASAIFKSRGITVISPPEGELVLPTRNPLWLPGSYPLRTELYISERQAKRKHLAQIRAPKTTFVYFVNPGRYIGDSTLDEFIMAYISRKEIYAQEPFDPSIDDYEPKWLNAIQAVQVKPAREVANIYKNAPPTTHFYTAMSRQTIDRQLAEIGFVDYVKPWEEYLYHGGPKPPKIPGNLKPEFRVE